MQPHSIVFRAAALAALLAGLGRTPSPGQATPPWKPFVPNMVAGVDGRPRPAILVPGPVPNTWVIIVGGSSVWCLTALEPTPTPTPTPPNPAPPAPPTPAEQIQKLAREAAEKLPAAGRQEDARKLAAVYRALADQIPAPIDSIDKLITANRYAREIALGPQRSKVWEPWVKEIGQWLDAQRAARTIQSVDDCKPVWRAIAEALTAVP